MKKSWIWIVLFFFVTSVYAVSAMKLWEKGKKADDKKDYVTAISFYKKATESDPEDRDMFRWLGGAYCRNAQYTEAVETLKQALRLSRKPDRTDFEYEIWDFLASAYKELGQLDSAISSRKKYIELKPDEPKGFLLLSRLYIWNKQFDEAITSAKRIIELTPDNADAYYCLGSAYRKKKQYAESFDALKKAVEFNPKNSNYHSEMGELFYTIDDYDKAIEAFKNAVKLQPNNLDYLSRMAASYLYMGKYDDAIAAINKVIESRTYAGVGVTWANESGYPVIKEVMETELSKKAGIEAGDKIIKINGESTKKWDNEKINQSLKGVPGTQFVLTIERKGENRSIDKTVTRETIIDKGAAGSFGLRSRAYRHKGSLELALQDAEMAYSLNPADGWAYNSLGAAYMDRGQYAESIKLLSQFKGVRANVIEATAYAKQGKMKEAENIYSSIPEGEISSKNIPLTSDLQILLQLFKPVVREHRIKARSLAAKGQYQEAMFELSAALKMADETEALAIRESIFSMTRMDPSLSKMLPEEARECVLRAEMLVKESNFEKAATECRKAIRIAPYWAHGYYMSALIYKELKKYPEAIRQMDLYLQAAPDAPNARAAKDEMIKWKFLLEKGK